MSNGVPSLANATAMFDAKERAAAKWAAFGVEEAERHEAYAAVRKANLLAYRRANALERHARLVYDTDRDIGGEFSAE